MEWDVIIKNQYLVLRHGHSRANQKGIIISEPLVGIKEYGLTFCGRDQIKKTSKKLIKNNDLLIYSSDFLRTRETAEIVGNSLGIKEIQYTALLRERYFGDFDGQSNENYEAIWEMDLNNKSQAHLHVESPQDVRDRLEKLIKLLEKKYDNRQILFISHGDCLQIFQTIFEYKEAYEHRSVEAIKIAELRQMSWDHCKRI